MKKYLSFYLFACIALLCVLCPAHLNAQDVEHEMASFAASFQDTYNKEDHAGLKNFYTADAKRVAKDGSTLSGADAIGAFWEAQFKGADATLVLTQQSVVWKDNVHAYVSSGTYRVTGTTAKGEKIDTSGKYANTMLKVNGAWKIAESVLTD